MKRLHIGLLLAGAVLVGGLAVKMTQPPPIPPTPAPVPLVIPPPVAAKPSPIPAARPSAPPPAPARAAAPQPVYSEPSKPLIRKNKPILLARAKPTQWTPEPYKSPQAPAQPKPAPEPAPSAPAPPVFQPRQVTLQTGVTIPVRLEESVATERSVAGDTFQASLAVPLVVDGLVIAERGARVTGRVIDARKALCELATLATSDGQRIAISTDPTRVGGGAGGVIRFRLTSPVTITEQQIAGR